MSTTLTNRRRMVSTILALALAGGLVGILRPASAHQPDGPVVPLVETTPVQSAGDAADDVAIWVDSSNPTNSVVIGTDKLAAIEVYDLTGARLHRYTPSPAPNGVDVRYGFPLGGSTVDVVATAGGGVMRFYTIDPITHELTDVTANAAGITPGVNANGLCMYQSRITNTTYAFATALNGMIEQWELFESAGKIDARLVRGGTTPWDSSVTSGSTVESCVADDDMGSLYVSEQDAAIWKYGAEPTDSVATDARTSVDVPVTEGGHFTPDAEGLAIVHTSPETGYLIASSQKGGTAGDGSFIVYEREGANAFVKEFEVLSGTAADRCNKTDGIEAVVANLNPTFTQGMFVCQDGSNTATSGHPGSSGNSNFKLVALETIVDLTHVPVTTTTTEAPTTTTTVSDPVTPATKGSGYWMVGSDGKVYAFGDAKHMGNAGVSGADEAVDLEPTPSGKGYWVVDSAGHVFAMGDAKHMGNADPTMLVTGEKVTSLSSSKSGNGYWIFTTRGRVLAMGDAVKYGDMSTTKLNGAVLDSIPTASGNGYYMVASDGGIFTFGDAKFWGSMGDKKINAPVQSLVPDGDGSGYWLVASDGGIFAFDAPFKGSMGATKLNKPVTGMVRFGNGYLMVGEDGGIFTFSDKPFHGSLGASPPARPIVSAAALG
jgi:3-phytase